MKNLNSFNQLVNLVTSTTDLSKHFSRIHDLAVYHLNYDILSQDDQSSFYFLKKTEKLFRKIEKLLVDPGAVEFTKLVDLIKQDSGELSESLIVAHNRICHNIDLMHYTPKVQSSLYFVFEAAKIIRTIEDELKTDLDTSN